MTSLSLNDLLRNYFQTKAFWLSDCSGYRLSGTSLILQGKIWLLKKRQIRPVAKTLEHAKHNSEKHGHSLRILRAENGKPLKNVKSMC